MAFNKLSSFVRINNLFLLTLRHVINIGSLREENIWIGATDLGREGDFYWDGIGDVMGPYSNWSLTQPDNAGGKEHCVHMKRNMQYWNDIECSFLFRYLCEGKIEEDAKLNSNKV
jgi:hypothetical protein